jgi:hypothetical protein
MKKKRSLCFYIACKGSVIIKVEAIVRKGGGTESQKRHASFTIKQVNIVIHAVVIL